MYFDSEISLFLHCLIMSQPQGFIDFFSWMHTWFYMWFKLIKICTLKNKDCFWNPNTGVKYFWNNTAFALVWCWKLCKITAMLSGGWWGSGELSFYLNHSLMSLTVSLSFLISFTTVTVSLTVLTGHNLKTTYISPNNCTLIHKY